MVDTAVTEQDEKIQKTDQQPQATGKEPAGGAARPKRRKKLLLYGGIGLAVIAIAGFAYWLYARHYESTDDAFLDGNIVQISPKVSGHVTKVYVADNQMVHEGDLLAEIDPRDFEARVAMAQAALDAAVSRHESAGSNVKLTRETTAAGVEEAHGVVDQARANVDQARAELAAAKSRVAQLEAGVRTAESDAREAEAKVKAAEAAAELARKDEQRYAQLYDKDEVSRQRYDQAMTAARTAEAQLEAARKHASSTEAQVAEARAAASAARDQQTRAGAAVAAAEAGVGAARGKLARASAAPQEVAVSESQAGNAGAEVEQARAALEQAKLQLSYTKIYAPVGGHVTMKSVEEGSLVQVGQALMALVYGEPWVVANFKETQLTLMQPGQPVWVKIDAYPDHDLRGHVDSIQRGTGSRFSLIPSENATGNFVKVVQRVPVKIVFDEKPDPDKVLAPGMSVEPTVRVQ